MTYFSVGDVSYSVSRKKGLFIPTVGKVRVSAVGPFVVMFFGTSVIKLRTVDAHKLGFALVRNAEKCDIEILDQGNTEEIYIVLHLNGSEITLNSFQSRQLGGALLRKSDFVDDWQILNNARITK